MGIAIDSRGRALASAPDLGGARNFSEFRDAQLEKSELGLARALGESQAYEKLLQDGDRLLRVLLHDQQSSTGQPPTVDISDITPRAYQAIIAGTDPMPQRWSKPIRPETSERQ